MSSESAPLGGLRFSLAGPGKVGLSLAAWLTAAGAELVASTAAAGLAGLTSAGQDLLLIAVPDGALAAAAGVLARQPQAAVALHTSGSQGAGALAVLRAGGTAVGTLHPLKAFPRPLTEPCQGKGVFLALDGDLPAVTLARRLATAWGASAAVVAERQRPLYHLAATLAAGGVATLLGTACDLAAQIGLPPEVTRGYLDLARGTVAEAIAAAPQPPPLTGPAARGDQVTFSRLIAALRQTAPERLPLVLELAGETLRLAAGRPGHADLAPLGGWLKSQQHGPQRSGEEGAGASPT